MRLREATRLSGITQLVAGKAKISACLRDSAALVLSPLQAMASSLQAAALRLSSSSKDLGGVLTIPRAAEGFPSKKLWWKLWFPSKTFDLNGLYHLRVTHK